MILSNNKLETILDNSNSSSSAYVLSEYINNPKLYDLNLSGDMTQNLGWKFNIRFYVLVVMDNLPTFKDIKKSNPATIKYFILNDVQIYFAVAPYNADRLINNDDVTNIPFYLSNDISDKDFSNLKNLTNLHLIDELNNKYKTNIDKKQFLKSFDELNFDVEYKQKVRNDFINICNLTLDAIKNDLRNINRHNKESNGRAYNIIAYDTMLDDNDKLWLIEVNRNPAYVGLHTTLGTTKMQSIFYDLFDIVVNDNHSKQHWDEHALKYCTFNSF
jgi:hypothetical protein